MLPSNRNNTLRLHRLCQMQLISRLGIMQATKLQTLCSDNLECKSGLVALFELHVHFFIADYHLVLQVPPSAPAELRDDGVAVAEEVNVEVGVITGLEVNEYV